MTQIERVIFVQSCPSIQLCWVDAGEKSEKTGMFAVFCRVLRTDSCIHCTLEARQFVDLICYRYFGNLLSEKGRHGFFSHRLREFALIFKNLSVAEKEESLFLLEVSELTF